MEISDLETYEQLQMEAVLRGMLILEFIKENKYYETDNKYFIIGKRIFAFDKKGNFLDCDYEVDGSFCCGGCSNSLISLVGAPKIVSGFFGCSNCKNLISLEGAPEIVKGNFNCSFCKNLISLKGAPKIVEGNFYCFDCKNLPNNIKKPKGIKGKFYKT